MISSRKIRQLLARKKGLLLDISLGGQPQPRAVTMADLGHDPRRGPFPLPKNCVNTAVVTHVLEYLDPAHVFVWFDELWRIMQPHGVVYFSGPYGGDESHGWLSDPQHRVRIIETTFAWLDPRTPLYPLHAGVGRTPPKPWHTQQQSRVPGPQATASYNVMIQKALLKSPRPRR